MHLYKYNWHFPIIIITIASHNKTLKAHIKKSQNKKRLSSPILATSICKSYIISQQTTPKLARCIWKRPIATYEYVIRIKMLLTASIGLSIRGVPLLRRRIIKSSKWASIGCHYNFLCILFRLHEYNINFREKEASQLNKSTEKQSDMKLETFYKVKTTIHFYKLTFC